MSNEKTKKQMKEEIKAAIRYQTRRALEKAGTKAEKTRLGRFFRELVKEINFIIKTK